jgi:hypothetical protein
MLDLDTSNRQKYLSYQQWKDDKLGYAVWLRTVTEAYDPIGHSIVHARPWPLDNADKDKSC